MMNNKFDVLKDEDLNDDSLPISEPIEMSGKMPDMKEHPLEYNYTMWFSQHKKHLVSYDQKLRQIMVCASIEQFWKMYSHLRRISDLETTHSTYHMFREGIMPMWEDQANKDGGKWMIRLRKGLATRCWENILLAMVGQQFNVGDEITGVVASIRSTEDILSIWNRTADDHTATTKIKDVLRKILALPPNTIMEYKIHKNSLSKNSYPKPQYPK